MSLMMFFFFFDYQQMTLVTIYVKEYWVFCLRSGCWLVTNVSLPPLYGKHLGICVSTGGTMRP